MNLTIAADPTELTSTAEILAGGTDLSERLRSGVTRRDVIDITRLPDLDTIRGDGRDPTTIGALVTIARIGADEHISRHYPALAAPARTLATPQIREMGTLGGVLCQRTRCWYYRHPHLRCFKNGGNSCPARDGNNHYGVVFDLGPCVYPHPSSIALGLLAYDATFDTTKRAATPLADLYGDGSDPTRDHQLADGELLRTVTLPPPTPGERSAYVRLMSRKWAEWPLVECVVRLVVDDDTITHARVCVGAVANIPTRAPAVENALLGLPVTIDDATLARAASGAITNANPPEQTRYKVPLVAATVLDTLEQALSRA
jgi:xanthine dehydrogenase YagS FAD-binding subunit